MNSINIIGRLTKDPEVRNAGKQYTVTEFTVAVDAGKDIPTDFIRCEAWNATGENIAKFFAKGDRIGVSGSLKVRDWTDDDGKYHEKTTVNVLRFDFCESMTAKEEEEPKTNKGGYSRR